jgi:uncharacterized protein
LANGQGVIIDATFGNPKHRRLFTELARRYNVPLLFIECRTDENTIRQRLKNRQDDEHEVSDATYSVYERLRADYRPLVEIPDSCRFELDTERELLAGITRLEAKLEP